MNNILSVMVVTYNRLSLTKQTFQSVLENTDVPFELIIVDNNSTDGTKKYLEQEFYELFREQKYLFFKSLKIHYNENNLGIAVGRNQCLKMVDEKSDYLSTIDNDVLLPCNWASKAITILQQNPIYGMLGVNFEGVDYPLVNKNGLEWQHKVKGNLGTACTIFNKSLHKLLGFFSQEYPGYAHEDADWGMRVRVLGLKLGYLKENGIHLGVGENDKGEYREFKNKAHRENLAKFNENCGLYMTGKKPIYIQYKGP